MSAPLIFSICRNSVLITIFCLAGCATTFSGSMYTPSNSVNDKNPNTPQLTSITPDLILELKAQQNAQSGQSVMHLKEPASVYLIGSGDILSIVIWGHPELAGTTMDELTPNMATGELAPTAAPPAGFVVDENGMLQFPFAGNIKVAGLTEAQARDALARAISHYINHPRVTLRIQSYRSKRIYIDGEVRTPGLLTINDIPMTLVEALNRAGGTLPNADQSQITINRADTIYKVNFPQMMKRGENPAKIMLRNGDVVRIPSRDENKVFVAGEVVTPKSLTMHDGRLTLNEALGESGGINPVTGDGSRVYIVRTHNKEVVVYQLDGNSPAALAIAENFELFPKDLVYVAATPLTNWSRTISLLFPNALSSAVGAAKPP
jgi:polysaccharide export outer membrane protein